MNACPCGCGGQKARDMFACRPGWFRLPKDLRDSIWRTWRVSDMDG